MQKSDRRKDRHTEGYSRRFDVENYDHINFKFRKDSGIMDALIAAQNDIGIPKNQYIREAVVAKLVEDGYMPEK